MRRIVYIFFIFPLFVLCLILFSSCDLKTDDEKIEDLTMELIGYLDSNDKEGIKGLFAKGKINDIENFDESIDELFEYYDGTYENKYSGATETNKDKDGKFINEWIIKPYDVTTSKDIYRIVYYYCSEYSTNKEYVGIWSLYIILRSDDLNSSYTYWGDGLWTPGINIGKVYIE